MGPMTSRLAAPVVSTMDKLLFVPVALLAPRLTVPLAALSTTLTDPSAFAVNERASVLLMLIAPLALLSVNEGVDIAAPVVVTPAKPSRVMEDGALKPLPRVTVDPVE